MRRFRFFNAFASTGRRSITHSVAPLLPKLVEFPTEQNSDSEKNMFHNQIWKSEIFSLQYLRNTLPEHCCPNWGNSPSSTLTQRTHFRIWNIHLATFEIYTSRIFFHSDSGQNWGNFPSSTMIQLVLGKWCTSAPIHQCPLYPCTLHHCTSTSTIAHAPLHIPGNTFWTFGVETPACTTNILIFKYSNYIAVALLFNLYFVQHLNMCGCVASFKKIQTCRLVVL